jgi:hypothetical protein
LWVAKLNSKLNCGYAACAIIADKSVKALRPGFRDGPSIGTDARADPGNDVHRNFRVGRVAGKLKHAINRGLVAAYTLSQYDPSRENRDEPEGSIQSNERGHAYL